MAFSRNSLAAAVAGTLSLAILTGCPATPPTGTGTPSAAPTAAGGSTAPTTTPTESAAPASAAPGSAAPSVTPSAANVGNATIKGTVYDLAGARVDAAKVRVHSLNPSNPYDTTVDVVGGAYVVNQVPAGVQLEIVAMKDGFTSRSRVESLSPPDQTNEANVINFGGAIVTTGDTEGPAYFISKYPEITAVDPAEDATGVDPTKVVVKLTLSEPLDTTNQRRFADAIRVFPTTATVTELELSGGVVDLEDETAATGAINVDSLSPFVVDESSTFLGEENTQATVTWDAEGKVATLTFNAPLAAAEDETLKYQIGLVTDGTNTIEDKDGNDLGMGNDSGFGGYSNGEAGDLIFNAFRETDLAVDSNATTDVLRWRQTHTHVSTFELAEDDTEPTLTGVTVTTPSGLTRISLTFSEPMGAYAGNSEEDSVNNLPSSSNLNTDNVRFTFAVAESAADLDDVDLDGDTVASSSTGWGAESNERESEFAIPGATVTLNPNDPKTVRLEVPGTDYFSNEVNAIKARVEGLADPAGNAITERSADANQKVGTI
jgi:hypothetical protein